MSVTRRFCLAPAFARLIKRERVAMPIIEGHFPDQSDRRSYVRMEGDHCILVLEDRDSGGGIEQERSEVSRAQGEVLLDVCAGKTTYERIDLEAPNGASIQVDRFTSPVSASFIRVTLPDEAGAKVFRAPIWFGAELGPDETGDSRRIALGAKPKLFDGPIHNAALESLIDLLDHRSSRHGAFRGGDDPMMSALKRLVKQPGDQMDGEGTNASKPAAQIAIVDEGDVAFDVEESQVTVAERSNPPTEPRLVSGSQSKSRA